MSCWDESAKALSRTENKKMLISWFCCLQMPLWKPSNRRSLNETRKNFHECTVVKWASLLPMKSECRNLRETSTPVSSWTKHTAILRGKSLSFLCCLCCSYLGFWHRLQEVLLLHTVTNHACAIWWKWLVVVFLEQDWGLGCARGCDLLTQVARQKLIYLCSPLALLGCVGMAVSQGALALLWAKLFTLGIGGSVLNQLFVL